MLRFPEPNFGAMSVDQLQKYNLEIDRLKEKWGNKIQIYKGLEVDYIPGIIDIFSPHIIAADLDYTIGAVHYVGFLPNGRPWGFQSSHEEFQAGLSTLFHGDIQACVASYYGMIRRMVRQSCPDIVAHLDRIKKTQRWKPIF